MAYFVVWLVAASFLFLRIVGKGAIKPVELPFKDWLVYVFTAALMGLFSVLAWGSQPYAGDFFMGSGWWLGLVGALIIMFGGYLKCRVDARFEADKSRVRVGSSLRFVFVSTGCSYWSLERPPS